MSDFEKQKTLPDLTSKEKISVPKKIGPYAVEGLYKKGGMSLLFLGLGEDKKPILIKVLSPKYVHNKDAVERFLKEAEIISLSHHPNIVTLYGQGTWENGLYIAMEYIQGVSLRQFILGKPFTEKRALEIILQVAYALTHLHSNGVIHRDLKPENILITEEGSIKVIDFGISQIYEERLPPTTQIIGTPDYMSPEQKKDPNRVTFASDIYSLGVIAYELVLGKLSKGALHYELLPQGLRTILEKSCALSLKERYEDIVDFITDLSKYLRTLEEEHKEEELPEAFSTLEKEEEALITPLPSLSHFEGVFLHHKKRFTSLILAPLEGTNGQYLLLAKPKEKGIGALFQSAYLKGIMEAEKDLPLSSYIQKLNEAAIKKGFLFYLALLHFSIEREQITFISSGKIHLYHSSFGKVTVHLSENPLLGENIETSFFEVSLPFKLEERIFLPFYEEEEEKSSEVQKALSLPLKAEAKKLFETVFQNSSSLLGMERIF